MRLVDGRGVYSPTDLNNFIACEHLTSLELLAMRGEMERPSKSSETTKILGALGEKHEQRYLEGLRAEGVEIVSISRVDHGDGDHRAWMADEAETTTNAMRSGAEAIYQATFFDGIWYGRADVLRRVDIPSELGSWSYEVEDTKLARSVEPYFLVQLCFYSEQVARIQGRKPERMYVVLGNGQRRAFRVNDFSAYYRYVKKRFLNRVEGANGSTNGTYPYPIEHCGLCRWDEVCSQRRVDDDHLSQVFDLTRLQEQRLRSAGITTVAELAATPEPPKPPKIEKTTFTKLTRQARLQVAQRDAIAAGDEDPYRYELLPPQAKATGPHGFALLPNPSPGDIFFDMEGDPYHDIDHGLEYLFGVYSVDAGFKAFWGCDPNGIAGDRLAEKRAFEAFIDYAMARRERFPSSHIFHYAPYEPTHLRKLSQEHATREQELGTLLREERFVDLYRIVRQTLAVGQPSYSIKMMEPFYGGKRSGAIVTGDESIVQFEAWLESRNEKPGGDRTILDEIARYNEQDCVSTKELFDWLRALGGETSQEVPEDTSTDESSDGAKKDPHLDVKMELSKRIPEDFDPAAPDARSAACYPFWLTAQLLEYHWRERVPVLWEFHDNCRRYQEDPEALGDESDVIIGLERIGQPWFEARSIFQRFRFPAQEFKNEKGDAWDPTTKDRVAAISSIEDHDDHGELTLKRDKKLGPPDPNAIVIRHDFPHQMITASLARLAQSLIAGETGSSQYKAARDMLIAAVPRFRSRAPGSNIQPDKVDDRAILELIEDLDDSYLFIQGPPGSGKTYQGAKAIVKLLASGKRIAIMANSHAAINNLLRAVEKVGNECGYTVRGQRRAKEPEHEFKSAFADSAIENVEDFRSTAKSELCAGTVWSFANARWDGVFDYLFIDEAGQVAMPVAVAMAMAAKSVVLLGDPLQLPHVSHGVHPNNIGSSILEYLLREAPGDTGELDVLRPISEDRGVLLTESWRMHPDVCAFISNLMYEGRLYSADRCKHQRVIVDELPPTGIVYRPIEHSDGKARSQTEATAVADLVERLLVGDVVKHDGSRQRILADDVIVVTPYNMQRRCIEKHLMDRGRESSRVRVGTVDKFQGQEADIVIISFASANPDNAPRGIEFIFDRNRVNVAISRSRALAICICSPKLLDARLTSISRLTSLAAACALRGEDE